MNRFLITGGAGFLGSHLCDRLVDMGCHVICLDNLSSGDLGNIAHLTGNDRFQFLRCDVTDSVHVDGPLSAVLHFASSASPKDYLEFPVETLKAGSTGTLNTLELAKAKQARYLLASTSEVYGDPLVNPQPETYWGNVNPISPRGIYDEAKRFAEALTMAYHRYHGLDTRIIRIFNTFGPRMRPNDGRLMPNLIDQALRDEPLTIHGDGSQTRSFCYVDDAVDGILRVVLKDSDRTLDERTDRRRFLYDSVPEDGHPSIHDPINLGNPNELSVREVAELVLKLTNSRSSLELKPLPADDPRVRRPDISKARHLLGWQPKVSLQEGLVQTIEYASAAISLEKQAIPGS